MRNVIQTVEITEMEDTVDARNNKFYIGYLSLVSFSTAHHFLPPLTMVIFSGSSSLLSSKSTRGSLFRLVVCLDTTIWLVADVWSWICILVDGLAIVDSFSTTVLESVCWLLVGCEVLATGIERFMVLRMVVGVLWQFFDPDWLTLVVG